MRADKVREIAAKLGRHVAILGDLQGPKSVYPPLKKAKFSSILGINSCSTPTWVKVKATKKKSVSTTKACLLTSCLVTSCCWTMVASVKSTGSSGHESVHRSHRRWSLSNNKGINKLGGGLSAEALTEKDKADIKTAALIGVDYLAVSFPRCGEDLNYARRLARDAGCDAKIVAKVERAEAVCSQDAMDDIILASDVVMVARGDLGVEIGDPELVGIQKALIRRARQLNRAVITATQMMESMITNPMPTRAEVMDVANAVLDGTDAVMLSAETAAGQYPSETVAAMARVCLGAEKIPSINVSKHRLDVQFDNVEEAIAMSAMYAANHLKGVTAIITMTESGRTALMTSRISSGLPIFAMSRHERTLNLTALYRGVTPVHFDSANDGVAAASEAVNLLRDKGYLMSGDLVIVTQGDVMSTVGSTNTTRILTVE